MLELVPSEPNESQDADAIPRPSVAEFRATVRVLDWMRDKLREDLIPVGIDPQVFQAAQKPIVDSLSIICEIVRAQIPEPSLPETPPYAELYTTIFGISRSLDATSAERILRSCCAPYIQNGFATFNDAAASERVGQYLRQGQVDYIMADEGRWVCRFVVEANVLHVFFTEPDADE
ncbi:MAG TPA: hypothetical protein VJB60_01850 [Candidatus Peribacterales bacterium]|nr:hypothetical protein [Candidatus Peribacterales bacterium]